MNKILKEENPIFPDIEAKSFSSLRHQLKFSILPNKSYFETSVQLQPQNCKISNARSYHLPPAYDSIEMPCPSRSLYKKKN